tara:strand:+ start:1481 stop:2734 length:1254 start_codon:yes stop_codon:yes gene_type:complete
MGFHKFDSKDLIYNQIETNPKFVFIVHNSKVYFQNERSVPGSFLDADAGGNPDNLIKHIPQGSISLHELNVNRPGSDGTLVKPFMTKTSTRLSFRNISTTAFDDLTQFAYGDDIFGSYPMSASISRIVVPAGADGTDRSLSGEITTPASHNNKKYIRSLETVIESQQHRGVNNSFGDLGSQDVNMICVPGIFYGSTIKKGSIKLKTYIQGVLAGTAEDLYSDGRIIQTYNQAQEVTDSAQQVGTAIYNQGILLLTSSNILNDTNLENYDSTETTSKSTWLNFGTGITQTGSITSHGANPNTSYTVEFEGVNKIPTMTMYAYSKIGKNNYSHNPTFVTEPRMLNTQYNSSSFFQHPVKIKSVNKSTYENYEEDFKNTAYISKIGIYDKYKNLIAIATLANPVKKTEKRDFLFKIGIDF